MDHVEFLDMQEDADRLTSVECVHNMYIQACLRPCTVVIINIDA